MHRSKTFSATVLILVVLAVFISSYLVSNRLTPLSHESKPTPLVSSPPHMMATAPPVDATRSAVFPLESAVTWEELSLTYTITGISLGTFSVPESEIVAVPGTDKEYAQGDKVPALVITLKVTNHSNNSACASMNIRRVINEEGDFGTPISRQFLFPSSGGCMVTALSSENQKIVFALEGTEKEYIVYVDNMPQLFFSIKPEGTDTLRIEKIRAPKWFVSRSPTPSPSPEPSFELLEPIDQIKVKRGERIDLVWRFTGNDVNSRVDYSLYGSASSDGLIRTQKGSFNAQDKKGSFQVTVLPGIYALTVEVKGVGKARSFIEVTSGLQKFSPQKSELIIGQFNSETGLRGQIINDGVCAVNISAIVKDEFGYSIPEKTVELHSDRMIAEKIIRTRESTDNAGTQIFILTSQTTGIATLTATVDGVPFENPLVLQIFDKASYKCSQVF